MRWIDADALNEDIEREFDGVCVYDVTPSEAIRDFQDIVDRQPTIEERKTGKWGEHGECPFCGYLRQWEDDRFCGNCGAKMEGETV